MSVNAEVAEEEDNEVEEEEEGEKDSVLGEEALK
jgi:hypothetical protein